MKRNLNLLDFKQSYRPALLALAFWFLGSIAITFPSTAQFEPSDEGLPGRREGGGTRGGCLTQQSSITALMPNTNFGYTIAAHPTLFWSVPQNSAAAAEFVLLDAENTEVYKTVLPVSQQAGIVQVQFPNDSTAPTLELNQKYRWYFSLICDPLDRSADSFTSGWIQRTEPSSELTQQLSTAAENQPEVYAEAGIWYDAIAALAQLRQAQPQNSDLLRQWQTLLKSVGLEQIANQPLLPMSATLQ